MSQQPELAAKVEELEKKLDATLNVIGKLVKTLDHMRAGDDRFIFEMDLVKHSLVEAGYEEEWERGRVGEGEKESY